MTRLTLACPVDLCADANQLAAARGLSMADATTFGPPAWRDTAGNLFSCASLEVSEEWLAETQQPLVRPAWDTEQTIDLTAAARAQSALVLWAGEGDPPQAAPGRLAVIVGVPGVEAVALMGLTQIQADLV